MNGASLVLIEAGGLGNRLCADTRRVKPGAHLAELLRYLELLPDQSSCLDLLSSRKRARVLLLLLLRALLLVLRALLPSPLSAFLLFRALLSLLLCALPLLLPLPLRLPLLPLLRLLPPARFPGIMSTFSQRSQLMF